MATLAGAAGRRWPTRWRRSRREVREQASPITSTPTPKAPTVRGRSAAALDRAGRWGASRPASRARACSTASSPTSTGRRNCCAAVRSRRRSCSGTAATCAGPGPAPAAGVHLFHYAADLARSPDEQWWVVDDRTQAPSGAGYALENRLVVSRVFPQVFRDLQVQHSRRSSTPCATRRQWAPRGDNPPPIAAAHAGTLQRDLLRARAARVTSASSSGKRPHFGARRQAVAEVRGRARRVHALLRRQDDDYCDPLELRAESASAFRPDRLRTPRQRAAGQCARCRLRVGAARLPAETGRAAARRAAAAALGGHPGGSASRQRSPMPGSGSTRC